MLSLSLEAGEYLAINDDVFVTVTRMEKGRCYLAIEADRNVPIVRGAVLERNGTMPPDSVAKLIPKIKKN